MFHSASGVELRLVFTVPAVLVLALGRWREGQTSAGVVGVLAAVLLLIVGVRHRAEDRPDSVEDQTTEE